MREDLLPNTTELKGDHAIQECCEFIKAVTKLRIFGPKAKDQKTGIEYDNVKDVKAELKDAIKALIIYEESLDGAYPETPSLRELTPEEYEAKVAAGKKIKLAEGGAH